MDSALESAYRAPAPTKATLIKIQLPGGTLRLTDGGFVIFAGELYLGKQDLFGSLDTVGQISEGGNGTTTRVEITLSPESDEAVALLADPLNQTSVVQWWEGAVNPDTGALIGTPKLKFQGQYDKARFSVGESWSLVIECGTQGELQLIANTDWRLNDPSHQRCWSGELGLKNVTWNTKPDYWRTQFDGAAITNTAVSPGAGLSPTVTYVKRYA